MIHRHPRWHRPRWDEIERIGDVITQQCAHCPKTRIAFQPNPRPTEPRRP